MTTRIATERAEGLRDELEEVRVTWREWTDRWGEFQTRLRYSGYNTFRLDAYQVGNGSDASGGQSPEGWLSEIESDLMGEPESDEE